MNWSNSSSAYIFQDSDFSTPMLNFTDYDPSKLEFFDIVPVDQISSGERLFVELDGNSIVLFNLVGKLFAIGDICSHDKGPVGDGEIDGIEIICPRHGARFDISSGKATALPAMEEIPTYPVRVLEGMVQIGISKS
jgi:3-phenylpropionate/trans-cinnamate dioxygenase ferredoxin subunit